MPCYFLLLRQGTPRGRWTDSEITDALWAMLRVPYPADLQIVAIAHKSDVEYVFRCNVETVNFADVRDAFLANPHFADRYSLSTASSLRSGPFFWSEEEEIVGLFAQPLPAREADFGEFGPAIAA